MATKSFRIVLDRRFSEKALKLMKKFPKKMNEVNSVSLFRIGTEVRSDGGSFAPYKTGTLRRSLTVPRDKNAIFDVKKNRVEVGTNLVYARAQEFGYKNIRARKYLTRAMKKQKSGRAEKIFSEEIDSIIIK